MPVRGITYCDSEGKVESRVATQTQYTTQLTGYFLFHDITRTIAILVYI